MYSSNIKKVVESAGWKRLLCAVPFLLLGCGVMEPIEWFPEAELNHFEMPKTSKRQMEEAIEVLQKHKLSYARWSQPDLERLNEAIKILSIHTRPQEVQVSRELYSEGLNGLINSLESLRSSGISAIQIVDGDDGSLIIKELKK